RIDCEDNVRDLDNYQNQQQQRADALAIYLREELVLIVTSRDAHIASHQPHDRILLGLNLLVFLAKHAEPGVDEESAEDVQNSMEVRDQGRSQENHRQPKNQSAQQSPEQNTMLIPRGNLEVRKDEDENK